MARSPKVVPFICNCRQEVVVLKWAIERDVCASAEWRWRWRREASARLHPQSAHVNGPNAHIRAQHSSSYTLPPLQPVWPRIARRLHSSLPSLRCCLLRTHTADWWVTWTNSDLGDEVYMHIPRSHSRLHVHAREIRQVGNVDLCR